MTNVSNSNSISYTFDTTEKDLSLKNDLQTAAPSEIGLTILSNTQPNDAKKSSRLLNLTLKPLRMFASAQGLGTDKVTRKIDVNKRAQLMAINSGELIYFGLDKQTVLEGMYFRAEQVQPHTKTILVCTGSHESYENYAIPMVEALKSMGHHVMVFNYEGFGNSQGNRSEEGIYRSVETAYQYLKQEKHCDDQSIVAWGYSLGSAAVSDLATKHQLDIVIDRGFSSMSQVAHQLAPLCFKTIAKSIFKAGTHFDNISKLKHAQGSVFIAQGSRDITAVLANHGQQLQQAIPKDKHVVFREVDSGHHHFSSVWFGQGEDRTAVEEFLRR